MSSKTIRSDGPSLKFDSLPKSFQFSEEAIIVVEQKLEPIWSASGAICKLILVLRTFKGNRKNRNSHLVIPMSASVDIP